MRTKILDLIDFQKVDTLLEGFNKTTGFVTAILDLEGNVLSKSGWRQICTKFHRTHPQCSQRCSISDTVLANKMQEGERFHFYQCLNGLIDVAVPIRIKNQHIANLFSGQFFFDQPDLVFFEKQAEEFGFDKENYLAALAQVPVVSKEKVQVVMDFLLNMTQLISDMTFQKVEQRDLMDTIQRDERILRLFVEHSPASIAMLDKKMRYIIASQRFLSDYHLGEQDLTGRSHYEVFPEISERWKAIHKRCLAGETMSADKDPFPRADGKTDWVRWEIRPWYESLSHIGGIILFSEVITSQVEDREALKESENFNRMLFEQSPIGLALTSLDGRLVDVNPTFSNIIGRTIEEAKTLTYWEITPDKYYLQEQEQLESLAKTGRYGPYEKEYLHKEGHLVPVRLQGLFVERNNEKFIWSSVEDISERKQTDEKLQENNSLIRIAAEKAKLGGWNVNLEENRSYWSDVVAAIHEMPPGYAPLVEDGINFYAPEWRDRIIKVFSDCVQHGIPYDEEMQIITSTGKPVWVRTIGEAVRDEDGKIYKVQGGFQDISEKKLAEEKNREKDLQFRKLSANLPDLIFQFTRKPDGTYCVPVASDGIKNIFGCSPEDVVDDFTPIAQVLHPDDTERIIADIEYSAEHLSYFTCEFRVLIPGRPVQWIFSRSTPERLPDGSTTWYGFNANITQRKEFEDALRESEGKFRKIYEEGPFGMALVNSEFKFIMVNYTFCKITGYNESELREVTFRDITYIDDKEKDLESVKKLIQGEIPVYKSEKRYLRKDGMIIWGAITVTAHFDQDGDFLYNVAIVEDITGRKQADASIKTLNDRLQLLVEAIQELSVSTSMENITNTVRTSARKLVNADGSTLVLRDGDYCYYVDEDAVSPLWKGQRFPLEKCISGWAMLNKQAVVVEDIYADERIPIEAYRSTFVKSLAMAPIRLNNPLGAIGAYWSQNYSPPEMEIKLLSTLADAAAKAVENIQLIDGLEHKIQERTSQLEAVNKELETFTYSVSHDLKAPLRGIDGYSKLLADLYASDLNDEAKQFITTIRSSTQLMSRLIDDLLQYSRLERSQLRSEPVMVKPIVDAILKINEDDINSHQFSIVVELSDSPIMADSNGIQMAMRNLIENAIKFSKSVPEPTIEIKAVESEMNWTISVSDNGIGFDMKYSNRIFEIFQRLHRVEDYPGTGIGLAIVSKSVQRMNGKAWAEGQPGQGASFFIEIPKPILNEYN